MIHQYQNFNKSNHRRIYREFENKSCSDFSLAKEESCIDDNYNAYVECDFDLENRLRCGEERCDWPNLVTAAEDALVEIEQQCPTVFSEEIMSMSKWEGGNITGPDHPFFEYLGVIAVTREIFQNHQEELEKSKMSVKKFVLLENPTFSDLQGVLTNYGIFENEIPYRDEMSKEIGAQGVYAASEYANFATLGGNLEAAMKALKGPVENAIGNDGRVTRLVMDGNWVKKIERREDEIKSIEDEIKKIEEQEIDNHNEPALLERINSLKSLKGRIAHLLLDIRILKREQYELERNFLMGGPGPYTLGDASALSIALGLYIKASGNSEDPEIIKFRVKAIKANSLILNGIDKNLNSPNFDKTGPLKLMSDKSDRVAISSENNIRYGLALYNSGNEENKDKAKILLQYIIDNTYDSKTRQFSEEINPETGELREKYARDCLGLLIFAADRMEMMTSENLKKFTEAYKTKPKYANSKGLFGYSSDNPKVYKRKISIIPGDFMLRDALAGYILCEHIGDEIIEKEVLKIAKKHEKLGKAEVIRLDGRYSTEYGNRKKYSANLMGLLPLLEIAEGENIYSP